MMSLTRLPLLYETCQRLTTPMRPGNKLYATQYLFKTNLSSTRSYAARRTIRGTSSGHGPEAPWTTEQRKIPVLGKPIQPIPGGRLSA